MAKFKVGDFVTAEDSRGRWSGRVTSIEEGKNADISGGGYVYVGEDEYCYRFNEVIEVNNQGEKKVARRTFKLIKDGPTMKKGALVQEECEDGTQPYTMINVETHSKDTSYTPTFKDRSLVEEQPEWFVEVFAVDPPYMTQEELDRYKEFLGQKKRGRPSKDRVTVEKVKSKEWTPERRAKQAKMMKKLRKERKGSWGTR